MVGVAVVDVDVDVDIDVDVDVVTDSDVDVVTDIDVDVDVDTDTDVDVDVDTEVTVQPGMTSGLLAKIGGWILAKGLPELMQNLVVVIAFQSAGQILQPWKQSDTQTIQNLHPRQSTGLGLLLNYLLNEQNPVQTRWNTFADYVQQSAADNATLQMTVAAVLMTKDADVFKVPRLDLLHDYVRAWRRAAGRRDPAHPAGQPGPCAGVCRTFPTARRSTSCTTRSCGRFWRPWEGWRCRTLTTRRCACTWPTRLQSAPSMTTSRSPSGSTR